MTAKPSFLPAGAAALLLSLAIPVFPAGAQQEAKPQADSSQKDQPAATVTADDDIPSQVSLHFERFSLAIADAAALMREPINDSQRYERVLEMLKNGKARQDSLVIARTKSGQRMVAESISEVRYPTEFGLPNFGTLADRQSHQPKDGPAAKLEANDPEIIYKDQIASMGPIPTAFETRNVGETVEVEPVIGPDGATIDLNMVPQRVRYVGETPVSLPFPMGQALFETQKITTSLTLLAGTHMLIGTCNPPSQNGVAKDDAAAQIALEFVTGYIVSPTGVTVKAATAGLDALQMRLVNVSWKNAPLTTVLEDIRQMTETASGGRTGLKLKYYSGAVDNSAPVTFSAPTTSVEEALKQVAQLAGVVIDVNAYPVTIQPKSAPVHPL